MPIETHCPNGHRVRGRDDVVGKTGRCPTCGATFRTAAEPELPVARLVQLDQDVVASLPRARALGASPPPVDFRAPPQPSAVDAHAGDAVRFAPEPEAAPVAPVPSGLHAAIAERPDLSWCIAFPGGAPTEPLDAPTMQAWLDGGHATGTEVVWRADWPEWRPVQDVFPDFFGNAFRF